MLPWPIWQLNCEPIKRSTQPDKYAGWDLKRLSWHQVPLLLRQLRSCAPNKMWTLQPKQIGRQAPLQDKAHSQAKHLFWNIQPSTPRSMPDQGKQSLVEQRSRLFTERMKALGSQPLWPLQYSLLQQVLTNWFDTRLPLWKSKMGGKSNSGWIAFPVSKQCAFSAVCFQAQDHRLALFT